MNYIKQSIWALAAIALVACSSDDDKDTTGSLTPEVNTTATFTASIESGNSASSKATRTSLTTDVDYPDIPYPVWSAGDQIRVYNATTPANALFSLKSDYKNQRYGVFEGTMTRKADDKLFALYCANLTGSGAPTLTVSNGSATITATIPSALVNYTADFHPEYHFMTACTTSNTFKFKNAMSLIRIDISNNSYANFVIRKIHFKAINGENIAGTFTASVDDEKGTIGDLTITGGSSEITVSNSDGSALGTGVYFIPVLPSTLSGGFTLTFENTEDGAIYERSNTKTNFTIAKSGIIDLGSFTAQDCAKEAYVDLDIKNSAGQKLLWSVENIYEYGYEDYSDEDSFYAWGETSVKANQGKTGNNATYSWYRTSTSGEQNRAYKYGYAKNDNSYTYSGGTLTKYNSSDGKTELEINGDVIDDVAYLKSNGKWRIPSVDDFNALINAATTINASTGNEENPGRPLIAGPDAQNSSKYKIQKRNSNVYITFPMKGYKLKSTEGQDEYLTRDGGYYWTRELGQYLYNAKVYKLTSTGTKAGSFTDEFRAKGCLVRGVMYR